VKKNNLLKLKKRVPLIGQPLFYDSEGRGLPLPSVLFQCIKKLCYVFLYSCTYVMCISLLELFTGILFEEFNITLRYCSNKLLTHLRNTLSFLALETVSYKPLANKFL